MTVISEKCFDLRKQFYHYYPSGHTNLKSIPENMRIIVARAKGAKIWDMDGTEYLDYSGAHGPNILGHGHPEYIRPLHKLIDESAMCVGGMFGFTENDVVVAEKLTRHVPCAEHVKLTTSGTEAVQVAMRVARSYTSRPYVLHFQDHYHGWIDNVFGHDMMPEAKDIPHVITSKHASLGRGPGAGKGSLMIEWNNIDALENLLKTCGDQIALIMMEAFASNADGRLPRPGYLERVRELCDLYGIVLCFDEVLTGFRVGLNSAQGLFGVTPDITTLGKALGGGMPIAAVVGKSEIMSVLREGKTICPGTYMGHFLSVRGVRSTIEILERHNGVVYKEMETIQKQLVAGLKEIAHRRKIPMRIQSVTGTFNTLFGVDADTEQFSRADREGKDDRLGLKFWQLMKEQGISVAPGRWFLNIMHTERDTEFVLEAADKTMAKL